MQTPSWPATQQHTPVHVLRCALWCAVHVAWPTGPHWLPWLLSGCFYEQLNRNQHSRLLGEPWVVPWLTWAPTLYRPGGTFQQLRQLSQCLLQKPSGANYQQLGADVFVAVRHGTDSEVQTFARIKCECREGHSL